MSKEKKQGGTGSLIKIAYRNIWRNKRRTAFCFTAVGIAVFVIAVYSSFKNGQLRSVCDLVQTFETGHVKLVSALYEEENEYMPVQYPVSSGPENPSGKSWKELAASLKKIPGVKEVFPRITTIATLQESTIKHAILWGINIEDETKLNYFNLVNRDDGIIEGRYPMPDSNECAIGYVFAKKAGLSVGDRIPLKTVSAQFSDKIWSPVITGIFNYEFHKMDSRFIIVDFTRLQRLLVLGKSTQQLVIFAENEKQSEKIKIAVRDIYGKNNFIGEWRDNQWVSLFTDQQIMNTIIFLVLLVVASFLIVNTMVMIIHERIKEIGMMGSLGMSRSEIIRVFFFESIILASLGALAGVFIAGIVTGIVSNYPLRLMDQYGSTASEIPMSTALFFEFSLLDLFRAWFMGVVIASVFTLIPSLKSAFVEPVEALRR